MAPVGLKFAGMFPAKIWNFPGAYVVWFMTTVSCSACVYTCYHYIKDSPDFAWRVEMRKDEDQQARACGLQEANEFLKSRARQHMNNSFFRKIAQWRDRTVPGGPNDKDCRMAIFRYTA